MNNEVLVKAENVSKKFCRSLKRSLWYGLQDIAQDIGGRSGDIDELRKAEFWAVKDVSFELKRGECLGLIGSNGAGKSTLLKMLNGLIKPDIGSISMRGKVGALIELGAGFNPILTGRENIYINGSVLGLTKKEIDKKYNSIVDFAEIEDFIDTPVQSYSSGMKVRLGFAIATHVEPDVLIIDEVLAVGDASFRAKCMGRIYECLSDTCVIFVSHSMAQVSRICNKGLYLSNGMMKFHSNHMHLVIDSYLKDLSPNVASFVGLDNCEIKDVAIVSGGNKCSNLFPNITYKDELQISITILFKIKVDKCAFVLSFFDKELVNVAECYSVQSEFLPEDVEGIKLVTVNISEFILSPGRYTVQLSGIKLDKANKTESIIFVAKDMFEILVTGNIYGYSSIQYSGFWKIS